MINAIPDAPSLTLSENSNVTGAATFGEASSTYTTPDQKTVDFSILYQNSDGILKTLADNISINIVNTHEYYILMYGTFASPKSAIIDNPAIVPKTDSNGNTIVINTLGVQFADTVDLGQSVDVYLTGYNDTLANSTPFETMSYGEVSTQQTVDAGTNYRIRVTPAGDNTTVLYDSGKVTLSAASNQIYLMENYFGPGTQKLRIVSISAGVASQLVNENLPTALRIANFIAGEPNIDVYFGNTNVAPLYDNVPYETYTPYQTFDPATEFINVTPHGDNLTFLYEQNFTLNAGESKTLFLAGDPNATAGISGVAIVDDTRPIATQLKLRFVDASANAGPVDFYVLQPGQPFSGTKASSSGATFLSHTTVPVAVGTYDLVVTLHNQDTVIAGPSRVAIDVGNWSAVLTDAPQGGPPFSLVISEDP